MVYNHNYKKVDIFVVCDMFTLLSAKLLQSTNGRASMREFAQAASWTQAIRKSSKVF